MNIAQIENNLQLLVNSFNEHTFIYELLLAYGQPKASIKRLQEGGLNLSKNSEETQEPQPHRCEVPLLREIEHIFPRMR